VFELFVTCDACGARTFFGVTVAGPISDEDLRARVVEKLGPDGAFVCPKCDSLVFVEVEGEPVAGADRLKRADAAQRIGRAAKGIRFGVGEPAGARSAVWRVWMNDRRDDVYIAARGLASELKVSLHPSFWYFGFTSLHAQRPSSLVPPGSDRKKRVWERPAEFGEGWTRAFSIIVPASEVVEDGPPYTGSEAVWFPKPADGEAVHFTILLSKKGAARGRRGYPNADGFGGSTEFVTRLEMATGEQLWVGTHTAPMTGGDTAQLEQGRAVLVQQGGPELSKRATEKPDFTPRALVFVDSPDGHAAFMDVSLATATHTA
jgi:hypothetical protein